MRGQRREGRIPSDEPERRTDPLLAATASHGVPGVPFWAEALRVAKPGAMLFAFGGTRTYHRLTCAIEDAGWDIKDCIMWVYASGFPKSHNISKAIDKAAGAEREVIGVAGQSGATRHSMDNDFSGGEYMSTAPATDAAQLWDGYGTALKPAYEPIVIAMKPIDGTYANNALTHGVAGLNIDGCRVGTEDALQRPGRNGVGHVGGFASYRQEPGMYGTPHGQGRWPANFIHDGSDEVVALFPSSTNVSKGIRGRGSEIFANGKGFANTLAEVGQEIGYGDSGSAARFFYCAKASASDRSHDGQVDNRHPTVKPNGLMRYLCRLVSMPGGSVILDPFMGSGSTGVAALDEGQSFIGIEQDADSFHTAEQRLAQSVPSLEWDPITDTGQRYEDMPIFSRV